MASRIVKQHDTKTSHWVRLLDSDGIPLNLTGCLVFFTLQDIQTGLRKVNRAAATVRDQTSFPGETFYQPTAQDRDTALYGSEEYEVLYPDTLKESFPVGEALTVVIQPDLDNV